MFILFVTFLGRCCLPISSRGCLGSPAISFSHPLSPVAVVVFSFFWIDFRGQNMSKTPQNCHFNLENDDKSMIVMYFFGKPGKPFSNTPCNVKINPPQ